MTPRKTKVKRGRTTTVWVAAGAVALVVAAGLLVALTRGGGRDATDPGVVHVHGLGINPRDGVLFVATHTGMFGVTEGRAVRVGAKYQDTMGFTIAGPDHFLGSGHPDPSEPKLKVPGKRPMLGLVESRDAGRTWDSVSLLGDADFHVLDHAHGITFGYDVLTGRFMASPDGRQWEARSTAPLLTFAVSRRDRDLVVASTDASRLVSRDGGRTWKVNQGPAFVALSWGVDDRLWGATPDGRIYVSTDSAGTWVAKGPVGGEPSALFAAPDAVYVAVHPAGIMRSTDGGASWGVYYRETDR